MPDTTISPQRAERFVQEGDGNLLTSSLRWRKGTGTCESVVIGGGGSKIREIGEVIGLDRVIFGLKSRMSGLLHYGCRGPERWRLHLGTPCQSGITTCAKTLCRKEYYEEGERRPLRQKQREQAETCQERSMERYPGDNLWNTIEIFVLKLREAIEYIGVWQERLGVGTTGLLWSMVWKSKRADRMVSLLLEWPGDRRLEWPGLSGQV